MKIENEKIMIEHNIDKMQATISEIRDSIREIENKVCTKAISKLILF